MDKIQLLQQRKAQLASSAKDIRAQIEEIIDADSFVELSAFSFSKNEFYGEDVAGEGVVTGYATVDGYPFYIVAQNYKVLDGGMSKASCDKIVKCLEIAEKNATPKFSGEVSSCFTTKSDNKNTLIATKQMLVTCKP